MHYLLCDDVLFVTRVRPFRTEVAGGSLDEDLELSLLSKNKAHLYTSDSKQIERLPAQYWLAAHYFTNYTLPTPPKYIHPHCSPPNSSVKLWMITSVSRCNTVATEKDLHRANGLLSAQARPENLNHICSFSLLELQ